MHRFHLPTMSCGGCLGAVTRALRAIDPDAQVSGDLARREVSVRSGQAEDALRAALETAGFPAEPVAQPLK